MRRKKWTTKKQLNKFTHMKKEKKITMNIVLLSNLTKLCHYRECFMNYNQVFRKESRCN